MLSFRHTRNFIRKHCAAIGKGDFRHCRNCRNTFYRCRHKSISQLLKRGTYHANATASRYTSDPFRHWNPASDHSADSGTDRNRSQLSGLYGGLQGRRTKRILSPAERVLSGKSTPDSAAGRQFACGRRRSFSTADAGGIKSRCSSGSFRKAATVSAMSRAFLPETAPGILL